ncbi:MAG: 50S ribosomal protein L17 [Verrucomicrobia subdivision 3 bacterium]|nr:50S ribosomal protein L17 [Limisphaerales bacterium]
MRHRKRTAKLGRTSEHRTALLANLVCSLIKHRKIQTTLAKAKAARVVADKMVTLGKKGQEKDNAIQCRRLVAARLQQQPRHHFSKHNGVSGKVRRDEWRQNEDVVRILFEDIAPTFAERNGGYTRVIKLGRRRGDAAEMAILEWVKDGDTPVRESKKAPQSKESKESKAEAVAEAVAEEVVEESTTAEPTEEASSEEVTEQAVTEEATEEVAPEETETEVPKEAATEEPEAKSEEEPKSDDNKKSD